jgi:23S rRNA pseudouridine2604 synthase
MQNAKCKIQKGGWDSYLSGMADKNRNGDSVSLNKYISDTGFCSRRDADNYIAMGRVTINDNVAVPGNRVGAGDVVEVDGEPLGKRKNTIYIAYNKPKGVTSTTDTKDKTNIIDAIGHQQRIFPVGRLDKDSEGLIFLTNDGNIVNKILRAGNEHEKEYVVGVDKPIDKEFVDKMGSGVRILGTMTQPCKVVQEGKSTFRITLVQGLNRQIRRMCEVLGYKVERLKRVRIMNVHLGQLPVGHWRNLTAEETAGIMRMVEGSRSEAGPKRVKKEFVRERKDVAKPVVAKKAEKTVEVKSKREGAKPAAKSYKDFRKGGKKR